MSPFVRRALAEQHGKAGLVLGWFGVFVLVLGALSLYRHELAFWVQEEVHGAALVPDRENREFAALAGLELLGKTASPEGEWHVRLPSERVPVPMVAAVPPKDVDDHHAWTFTPFDAGEKRLLEARRTNGGSFLYRLHVELFGMGRAGRAVVALGALFMLAVVVSGVLLKGRFVRGLFTFGSPGAGRRIAVHCALGGLTLPLLVPLVFSGLVLSAQSFLPSTLFPHYREDRRSFVAESKGMRSVPDAHEARDVYDAAGGAHVQERLRRLLDVAEARWEGRGPGMITVRFRDGEMAEMEAVESRGTLMGRRSAGERLVLPMPEGDIETRLRGREPGAVATLWYAASALHLGRFASPETRFLLCLTALLAAAGIGAGLLFRERRAQAQFHPVQRLSGAMTTLVLCGLPLAAAAHLLAARLLPVHMPGRVGAEISVFFAAGLLSLVHALVRREELVRFEQFLAAALCAGLLSLLAFSGTDPGPLEALLSGLPVVFGTAFSFLAAFCVLAGLTGCEWRYRENVLSAWYGSMPARAGAWLRATLLPGKRTSSCYGAGSRAAGRTRDRSVLQEPVVTSETAGTEATPGSGTTDGKGFHLFSVLSFRPSRMPFIRARDAVLQSEKDVREDTREDASGEGGGSPVQSTPGPDAVTHPQPAVVGETDGQAEVLPDREGAGVEASPEGAAREGTAPEGAPIDGEQAPRPARAPRPEKRGASAKKGICGKAAEPAA